MIFLFDNCYLSTSNQINETCKHVWIGSHDKLDYDNLNTSYDVYKTYKTITNTQLKTLLNDIHKDLSDTKVIIYCDVKYYQMVYSSFFGSFLSTEGLKELYKYDRLKENHGIGNKVYGLAVTGFKETEHIYLPEDLTISKPVDFIPAEERIEIAFANYVAGDQTKKEYCISKICQMYDGSPGFWAKYIEQNIPAILNDSEYTMANLLNEDYINNIVASYEHNEIVPNKLNTLVKEEFDFDYLKHFFTVMNSNDLTEEEYLEYWQAVSTMTKEEFVETRLINTNLPISFQLLFPNLSNFDSVNPILWNKIFEYCNDTEWLSKFELIDGTNNQTD
jgi:hypothetical protein